MKRGQRWNQQLTVLVSGVIIFRMLLDQEQSANEKAAKQEACERSIQILMKDYMRIYDDVSSGHLRLITADNPITNDQLEDIISSNQIELMDDETILEGSTVALNAAPIQAVKTEPDESNQNRNISPVVSEIEPQANVYFLQEQKLRRVRDNLSKIPSTFTSSHRLNAACVRAQVTLKFNYKAGEGSVALDGVFVSKAKGSDEKSVKEQACNLALEVLLQQSSLSVTELRPGGYFIYICAKVYLI